jgi:hypothetical protein
MSQLPIWARYLLAAAIATVVGGLAWFVHGRGHASPGWYASGLKVAAVGLLAVVAAWLVHQLIRRC